MDAFNMKYLKSTAVHKLKNSNNNPVYEDKSDPIINSDKVGTSNLDFKLLKLH